MPVFLPGLTFGGLGYGGASYGYSPYGSGALPRPTTFASGGYGGGPYGTGSYGSLDVIPPEISSVVPLDGFRVEVFFSEELAGNAALFLGTNYVFVALSGVAVTASSVVGGTAGTQGGYTSVVVTHSGTTLGGQYSLTASNLTDIAGNVLSAGAELFYALGDTTAVQVSLPVPDDGRTVQLDFQDSNGDPQDLLTEAQFTPGVGSTTSYEVATSYPVAPTLSSPSQDASVLSRVQFDLHPMTSATYNLTVGPSDVYQYSGSVLPSADPNLTAVEIGTGTSVADPAGLILSKASGVAYGWALEDDTGRIVAGSSYRADFQVDVTSAAITPAVFNSTLATLSVSDGAIQVDLRLEDVAGIKVLGITSGAYSTQAPASWSTAAVTVSLVRNQQAGIYAVLLDGTPLISFPVASATGVPSYSAGTAVVLSTAHAVSLFKLVAVDVSASSTLFTSTWNFIHGLNSSFAGSSVLAVDRIRTKRGPLVRGWGDATPATEGDVEVRLDGSPIEISSVNPYVGEIYPALPIPRAAPGTFSVEVDYIWFPNPTFAMAGLNTPGLVLNSWANPVGTQYKTSPPGPGAVSTARFPMRSILGPTAVRSSPKKVAHRYIGFQKEYSALLNQPTTLLLNKNPHAYAEGGILAQAEEQSGSFDGQATPSEAATPWTLSGVDAGGSVGDGTYRVIDASSGTYSTGTAAVYGREFDLALPAQINQFARFQVESYTADGVFTGVAFGFYNGNHLFLAGALVVNGFRHVGVLVDAENPQLEASWEIGPKATATALASSQVSVPFSSLPSGVGAGSRLRVAEGAQAGIYTISECGIELQEDGVTVVIDLEPSLPADLDQVGATGFEVFFEVPWDENLVTLSALGEWPEGSIELTLSGEVGGTIATISEVAPYPAQTSLLLPEDKDGIAFWGSISRPAVSSSLWDITQYRARPEALLRLVRGLYVLTEMNVLPDQESTDSWYIRGGFGYSEVDSTGGQLVLKSTSGSGSLPLRFGYQRTEPYLNPKVITDLTADFRVESGYLGAGDVSIRLADTGREVELTTLLYTTSATGRALVADLPSASLSGLLTPLNDGWEAGSGTLPTVSVRGQVLDLTKTAAQNGEWCQELEAPATAEYEGVVSESRLLISSGTAGSVGLGPTFGCRVEVSSGTVREVVLGWKDSALILVDNSGAEIASISYAWDDGAYHTYRMSLDPVADSVVVVVDDAVLASEALSSFASQAGSPRAILGARGDGAATWSVESTSLIPLRPVALSGSTLGRTLGLRKRSGSASTLDGWVIPRSDSSTEPNSSLSAAPVEMDWRSYMQVRLLLDPIWGVTLYRPDLPSPATGLGRVTPATDLDAAWGWVEYSQLPVLPTSRGCVEFGAVDPEAISQSRWKSLRYRLRGDYDGYALAPQGMVLNRATTFRSGEFTRDVTPEVRTFTSRTSKTANLFDSAVLGDRIFNVQVDGSVLSSSAWSFEEPTQEISFSTALPGNRYPITVTFAPKRPETKEYLCSQPLEGSVTILNEGTPPVPKSRGEYTTTVLVNGSALNDPSTTLSDAEKLVLNDPYNVVEFQDGEDSLYAGVEYCEDEAGDSVHLSLACDELALLELDGSQYANEFTVEGGPAGIGARQGAVIRGSAVLFNQTSIFIPGGGTYGAGNSTAGGGEALTNNTSPTPVLYPNARGPGWEAPPTGPRFGYNQEALFVLEDVTPREDDFLLSSLMGDNVPPSSADPDTDPNPDGTPGTAGNGAAAYELVDDTSPYSRPGPWGQGVVDLSAQSLIGGGAPLDGTEFFPEGGAVLPKSITITTGTIEAAN